MNQQVLTNERSIEIYDDRFRGLFGQRTRVQFMSSEVSVSLVQSWHTVTRANRGLPDLLVAYFSIWASNDTRCGTFDASSKIHCQLDPLLLVECF